MTASVKPRLAILHPSGHPPGHPSALLTTPRKHQKSQGVFRPAARTVDQWERRIAPRIPRTLEQPLPLCRGSRNFAREEEAPVPAFPLWHSLYELARPRRGVQEGQAPGAPSILFPENGNTARRMGTAPSHLVFCLLPYYLITLAPAPVYYLL